jgi:hypothetical protein
MLRTVRRPPLPGRSIPVRQSRKKVRLFARGRLVAERWTERDSPNSYYGVGSAIYDVESFVHTLDVQGSPGFDAEVSLRHA